VSGFSYQVLANPATGQPVFRWEDTSTLPWQIQSKAERALSQFQAKHLLSSMSSQNREERANASDVLIFPILQAGQFNVREEERTLSMLFDHLASREHHIDQHVVDLTSGYFGLSKQYQDLILKSNVGCNIIAASPKVNLPGVSLFVI
jgi:CDP-diacylglycerol--glycerol-3-phosphate 3-phosphatidyltransferase